ncbi:MAG TPA: hypothetical protein VLH16_03850, partial [Bacteroidales bacterium]|nr:hypothetical protein [Bacteroidales bacterium]
MRILIILLAVVISGQLVAQHNFRFYDSLTYRLYSQHSWKELTRVGKEALRAGNDYYFLRMRLGIAAAERNKHRLAANHFNKALRFNSGSSLGKSYIVDSHLKSGMEIENDRFESVLTQNRKSNPLRTITFTVGGAIPTAEGRTTAGNVDGDANIYGELTHSGTIGYLHAGAT